MMQHGETQHLSQLREPLRQSLVRLRVFIVKCQYYC